MSRSPRYALPVQLCRFGVRAPCELASGFSRQHGLSDFPCDGSASRLGIVRPGLAWSAPYSLTPGQPTPGLTYPPASPRRSPPPGGSLRLRPYGRRQPVSTLVLGWARTRWYRNINRLCIDYASRPRLSSRLTLGGLAFPRNPWTIGGGVSHPSFATHAGIRTRTRSTSGSRPGFTAGSTLPYHPHTTWRSAASALCLSPVTLSARDHSTSELLRTLSRMAASEPTSWLSSRSHIVSHLAQNSGP